MGENEGVKCIEIKNKTLRFVDWGSYFMCFLMENCWWKTWERMKGEVSFIWNENNIFGNKILLSYFD